VLSDVVRSLLSLHEEATVMVQMCFIRSEYSDMNTVRYCMG